MLCEVQDRRVTLDMVTREASMSPFHFIRQFHALFGGTPHQARILARLECAKHLLARQHASVTDVCLKSTTFLSASTRGAVRALVTITTPSPTTCLRGSRRWTIMTVGTSRDATLQELRIETFFPADAESEACWKRRMVRQGNPDPESGFVRRWCTRMVRGGRSQRKGFNGGYEATSNQTITTRPTIRCAHTERHDE
jgi:hypothetical protein